MEQDSQLIRPTFRYGYNLTFFNERIVWLKQNPHLYKPGSIVSFFYIWEINSNLTRLFKREEFDKMKKIIFAELAKK